MTKRPFGTPILLALCAWAASAAAGDPNQIIGKWIERFPNGNGMITEFTSTTIASFGVDASGKQTTPARPPMSVTYKDLGNSIGVNFAGGGGIMVVVKGPDDIVLDFPGMGAHKLTRIKP